MDDNDSFQNGQESKEMDNIGESPFARSTGNGDNYYRTNINEAMKSNNFSENSHNQKWYTEQREEATENELVSTSLKLDKLFHDAEKQENFQITQTFDYRKSTPEKYDNQKNSTTQERLFKNSQKINERSPIK